MAREDKKGTLLKLFFSMLYISAFTFGGGFVIITFMKRKFVDELGWIDEQEMLDLTALAQSSPGAIAVYGYLLRIEDRTTYQCYPSYGTIGSAVGMSKNTVRKYVAELEERRLIQTEPTSITTVDGRK